MTHPGTIAFIDESGQKVLPYDAMPESIAFAREGENLVPVVKVVATTHGDRRELKSYGPAGQLLKVTFQRK